MLIVVTLVSALIAGLLTPAGQGPVRERAPDRLAVPGAEHLVAARLDDLTTAGTVASGHTDPADWAGLHAAGTVNPSGVAGIQLDGYFPDTSTTNTNHGWQHDAQFVIRLPDRWNGGLIITGAPGNREQYANDYTISDYVLSRGYAFAATDKGNTGPEFHTDGDAPGDAIAEWNRRVTELTLATKAVARQRYGHAPRRTYLMGMSNGGYLVRWQLENRGRLYDGGVDYEGALWSLDGDNLLTFLPEALRAYPGDPAGVRAAGFPPGSEFLWPYHYANFWQLTARIYQKEMDPSYTGDPADYDYHARRPYAAVAKVALTGRITKPLITLHGTLDCLLPISRSADQYAEMVGPDRPFRYHRIEGGNHFDGLVDTYPDALTPMVPQVRDALVELEQWVGR
ncbi:alpha/beta hydrolase family protein [Nonomuraea sp. NPDC004297]